MLLTRITDEESSMFEPNIAGTVRGSGGAPQATIEDRTTRPDDFGWGLGTCAATLKLSAGPHTTLRWRRMLSKGSRIAQTRRLRSMLPPHSLD